MPGNTQHAANLTNRLALLQGNLRLAQHADDLFRGIAFAAHSFVLLQGSECAKSLNKLGPLFRGHSTAADADAHAHFITVLQSGAQGSVSLSNALLQGLAIVREVAERHCGSVALEDGPGGRGLKVVILVQRQY